MRTTFENLHRILSLRTSVDQYYDDSDVDPCIYVYGRNKFRKNGEIYVSFESSLIFLAIISYSFFSIFEKYSGISPS